MAKMNLLAALQAALEATKDYVDDNHYNQTEIDTLLDGKSDDNHTHKYAGSSSAGGAATSANKVNQSLKVQLNGGTNEGTNQFTFDGSAAKTINITPDGIGAAKASHGTHVSLATATPLVASGTGAVGTSSKQAREDHVHPVQTSVSGNAGSANKVNNSLIIKLNGGTTEGTNMFTFDGSGAKTIDLKANALGAPTSHNHDDRYYTETEMNTKLSTLESTAKSYTDTAITNLVNSAPDAMNTLKELADAIDAHQDVYEAYVEEMSTALAGKADSSHGTHVTWATNAPKANGTAAIGSAARVAREDHVHPLQTSVSGNAGTATKFASAQSVALTGDVTGSASSQAGWSVTTTLSNSGVTAGSYGQKENASPAHQGTFSVPYITVDAKGRVTAASTKTITLPKDNNTTYNVATTSANGLMSSGDKSKLDGIASGAEVNQNAFANVKVGDTTVAADAKQDTIEFVAGSNITITPDATNDKITIAAKDTVYTHPNDGANTGSFGNSSNQTPGYGSTFNVPYITVNSKGHVTAISNKTVKIPASDNTWRGIQDNLTSTSTSDSLSANQGKVLKGLVDTKADMIEDTELTAMLVEVFGTTGA